MRSCVFQCRKLQVEQQELRWNAGASALRQSTCNSGAYREMSMSLPVGCKRRRLGDDDLGRFCEAAALTAVPASVLTAESTLIDEFAISAEELAFLHEAVAAAGDNTASAAAAAARVAAKSVAHPTPPPPAKRPHHVIDSSPGAGSVSSAVNCFSLSSTATSKTVHAAPVFSAAPEAAVVRKRGDDVGKKARAGYAGGADTRSIGSVTSISSSSSCSSPSLSSSASARTLPSTAPAPPRTPRNQTQDAVDAGSEGIGAEEAWCGGYGESSSSSSNTKAGDGLSLEQEAGLALLQSGVSADISGAAGAGKTFLGRRFLEWAEGRSHADWNSHPACYMHVHDDEGADTPRYLVTAYSGVAANNIGGRTLHSAMRIPFGTDTGADPRGHIDGMLRNRTFQRTLQCLCVLWIDEWSMLHCTILMYLNLLLRLARPRWSDRWFGGVQVIGCGDMKQLPPVMRGKAPDGRPWKEVRPTYAFECLEWAAGIPNRVVLTSNFRQAGDAGFAAALDRIGIGVATAADIAMLRTREHAVLDTADGVKPLHIVATHARADEINTSALRALPASAATQVYVARKALFIHGGVASTTVWLPQGGGHRVPFTVKTEVYHNVLNGDARRAGKAPPAPLRAGLIQAADKLAEGAAEGCLNGVDVGALPPAGDFGNPPPSMRLTVGMPVSLCHNMDATGGLFNGAQGVVLGFAFPAPDRAARGGVGVMPTNESAMAAALAALQDHRTLAGGGGVGAPNDAARDCEELASKAAENVASSARRAEAAAQADGAAMDAWHPRARQRTFYPHMLLPVVKFVGVAAPVVVPFLRISQRALGGIVTVARISLRPAAASTVHRAQGLTLARVVLDLADCFEDGQVYVALSRAVSLNAISLRSFDPRKIRVCRRVLEFTQDAERVRAQVKDGSWFRRQFGPAVVLNAPPPLCNH